MSNDAVTALIDCDEGRRLGCRSFCCRLLVRLKEHERTEVDPDTNRLKGFVDKDEQGMCIHQDKKTGLCSNWENRPTTCREYDCNYDKLLQVVIRSSQDNMGAWMRESVQMLIPQEQYIKIPCVKKE